MATCEASLINFGSAMVTVSKGDPGAPATHHEADEADHAVVRDGGEVEECHRRGWRARSDGGLGHAAKGAFDVGRDRVVAQHGCQLATVLQRLELVAAADEFLRCRMP